MQTNRKLLLAFIITALVLGACSFNISLDLNEGSGNVTTQERAVSGFDRIQLNGMGDVILTQGGDQETLTIEAEDNVLKHITTEVRGGVLYISFDRPMLLPTRPIRYYLSMRDIRGLESKGASNIQAETIEADRLEIGISGTGNVNIAALSANQLHVNISGAGNLKVDGEVKEQRVNLSGAGNYDSADARSQHAEIIITGLGKVTVWVQETLTVTISGAGGVDFYGSPQITQQISGVGNLKRIGEK